MNRIGKTNLKRNFKVNNPNHLRFFEKKIRSLLKAYEIYLGDDIINLILCFYIQIFYSTKGFLLILPYTFFYSNFHFIKNYMDEDYWNYLFIKKSLNTNFILKHYKSYSLENWFLIFTFQNLEYIHKDNFSIPLTEYDIEMFRDVCYQFGYNLKFVNNNYNIFLLYTKKYGIKKSILNKNDLLNWLYFIDKI